MDRVIAPLREMGASIVAEGPDETPPLRIQGGSLAWNSLSTICG